MPLPQERPPLPRKVKGWCIRTGPVIFVLHPDGQKGLAIGRLYWQALLALLDIGNAWTCNRWLCRYAKTATVLCLQTPFGTSAIKLLLKRWHGDICAMNFLSWPSPDLLYASVCLIPRSQCEAEFFRPGSSFLAIGGCGDDGLHVCWRLSVAAAMPRRDGKVLAFSYQVSMVK